MKIGRGYSSAGRAPALQAGGRRFDPDYLHQVHKGPYLSWLERTTDNRKVGGSSPLGPTNRLHRACNARYNRISSGGRDTETTVVVGFEDLA